MKKFLKKYGFNLAMLIIFLIGTAVVAYPTISEHYNQKVQSRAINEYKETVAKSGSLADEKTMAVLYNDALYSIQKNGRGTNDVADYNDVLNIGGDGLMAYINIPTIDMELPIYHGTDDSVLRSAVGHLKSSSLPVGGENTHVILFGHRGLPSARLFNDIDQLTKGDLIELHTLDDTLYYEVYKTEIVEPIELNKLHIEKGKDLVTLVTCTPYGINTHRLLVHAKRISISRKETLVYAEARKVSPVYTAVTVGVFLWAFTMLAIIYVSFNKRSDGLSRDELMRRNRILENFRNRKGGG